MIRQRRNKQNRHVPAPQKGRYGTSNKQISDLDILDKVKSMVARKISRRNHAKTYRARERKEPEVENQPSEDGQVEP